MPAREGRTAPAETQALPESSNPKLIKETVSVSEVAQRTMPSVCTISAGFMSSACKKGISGMMGTPTRPATKPEVTPTTGVSGRSSRGGTRGRSFRRPMAP